LSLRSFSISQVTTIPSLYCNIYIELAQNPLVRRVIAVLDKNKDGNISFLEFVQGLNSLSAGASQEEKLRFAFQIYDINNDGYISNGELFTVLKMMVGSNLNDVQL
jgi:serine/threonine-protein phosphatase 2B regulatory subunit